MKNLKKYWYVGVFILVLIGVSVMIPRLFGKSSEVENEYTEVKGFDDCIIDDEGNLTFETVCLEPPCINKDIDYSQFEETKKDEVEVKEDSNGRGYRTLKDINKKVRVLPDGTVATVDKVDVEKKKVEDKEAGVESYITLNINCCGILDNTNKDDGRLPQSGQILTAKVKITDGETLDVVLKRVCDSVGIMMTNPTGNYVNAMDNLNDGDGLQMLLTSGWYACPGWMYSLNGVYPMFGLSYASLYDGDVVVWNYDAWKLDLTSGDIPMMTSVAN